MSFEIGAGARLSPLIGVDVGYSHSVSLDGNGIYGNMFTAGAGAGLPIDMHAQFSFTSVSSKGLSTILRLLIKGGILTLDTIFGV